MGRRSSSRRRHGTCRRLIGPCDVRAGRESRRMATITVAIVALRPAGGRSRAGEQFIAAETLQLPHSCSLAVNFSRRAGSGRAEPGGRRRCGALRAAPTIESRARDEWDKPRPVDERVKPSGRVDGRVYRRAGRGRPSGEGRGDGDGPRRAALSGPGRDSNQSLPVAATASPVPPVPPAGRVPGA